MPAIAETILHPVLVHHPDLQMCPTFACRVVTFLCLSILLHRTFPFPPFRLIHVLIHFLFVPLFLHQAQLLLNQKIDDFLLPINSVGVRRLKTRRASPPSWVAQAFLRLSTSSQNLANRSSQPTVVGKSQSQRLPMCAPSIQKRCAHTATTILRAFAANTSFADMSIELTPATERCGFASLLPRTRNFWRIVKSVVTARSTAYITTQRHICVERTSIPARVVAAIEAKQRRGAVVREEETIPAWIC